jgi:uncharacterized cupredoxin-like copper-binding protein/mono/diheme cytochrome c family protein
MNTGKQINAMVVVLLVMLIAVGAYTIWDPFRSESAEDEQVELAAERAATTYALNCRLCHGDRGEGGSAGGRLPAAVPLDRPDLRGIRDGVFVQSAYDEAFDLITDTITCGRVGTAMPTWGATQGGILNEEQIRQLAVLITEGRWDLAQEHADEIDAETTDHAEVAMPAGSISATDTEIVLSNAGPFTLGQFFRIGEERLRVRRNELLVERGVDGTAPAAHDTGALILPAGEELPVPTGPELRAPGPQVLPQDALREAVDDEATVLAVSTLTNFSLGDVLQIDGERVRVTGLVTGIPTTSQRLAEDIGRAPERLLVTGAEGIEAGAIIRIENELLEVLEVRDDGDPDIVLDAAASASDDRISVENANFFSAGYVLRVDDELIEVVGAVESRQTLSETIGRAETLFPVSGTANIQPGTVIRIGGELMRVTEIVQPARLEVERAADGSSAASHAAGAEIRERAEEPEDEEMPLAPQLTGQALLADLDASATSIAVTGITGIEEGVAYLIDGELVTVVAREPAQVRVERAIEGTERASHPSRSTVYLGNLLQVERGAGGTSAAAHDDGDEVFLTELSVRRAAGESAHEEHGKNTEIYLGNTLNVQRGALGTDPAEHANGELARDFPPPPENPTITGSAGTPVCGQFAGGAPGAIETPIPDAADVAISLAEWMVSPDPVSIAAGPVNFQVTNDGTTIHNFRVFRTDLAPDALPLDGTRVDEESDALDVVGGFTDSLQAGASRVAPVESLEAGAYVLICNIPGHYQQGMFVGFEATAP